MASERANAASLQYLDYGTALKEREHLEAQFQQLSEMDAALHLTSPISGTVVSPRVRDMLGTYLHSGGELLEIADLTSLRARIYISEYDLSKIQPGAEARVLIEGVLGKRDSQAAFIAPQPTEMDPRLIGEARLLGLNPPHFYLVDLTVPNRDMALRPGMAGLARVYGRKRSLLGMAWEAVSNFWGRKLW